MSMLWSMQALRAVLVLLGCLLALVGCGGGDSPPLAVGLSTSNAGARFQWRTASAPDPVTAVSVKDAEGTVVTAGAGQLLITVRDDAADEALDVLYALMLEHDGDIAGTVEGANLLQVQFPLDADLTALEALFGALPQVEAVSLNELAESVEQGGGAKSGAVFRSTAAAASGAVATSRPATPPPGVSVATSWASWARPCVAMRSSASRPATRARSTTIRRCRTGAQRPASPPTC